MSKRSDAFDEKQLEYTLYVLSMIGHKVTCKKCKKEVEILSTIRTVIDDNRVYDLCKDGCDYVEE